MKKLIPIVSFCIVMAGLQYSIADILNSKAYVTAKNGLVMRKGPKRDKAKIDIIPYNTKVTVTEITLLPETIGGIQAPWAYVKYKNKRGWVFSGYLDFNRNRKLHVAYGRFKEILSQDLEYLVIIDKKNNEHFFVIRKNMKGIPIKKIKSRPYKKKNLKITWKKFLEYSELGAEMTTNDVIEKIELAK